MVYIVFAVAMSLLLYHYILYPILIWILARTENTISVTTNGPVPISCSVLIAAHNEDLVIEKKIKSIFRHLPKNMELEVYIGTDACTDNTESIVERMILEYAEIRHISFAQRQGKANIINTLATLAQGQVLIITDANIIFGKNVIEELLKPFQDTSVGLVDTRLVKTGMNPYGISVQESVFTKYENVIKQNEGRWKGMLMGPSGACYAVLKTHYIPVPAKFMVDDFFIGIQVLLQGKKAVSAPMALVYEDSTHRPEIEFRRKVRIATGNMQNLFYFARSLKRMSSALLFTFVSHKVLRWIGPIFILTLIITSIISVCNGQLAILPILVLVSVVLPFFDYLLRLIGIHIIFLRSISHFYAMNLALMLGIIKYIKGVQNNVWQPTKRNLS